MDLNGICKLLQTISIHYPSFKNNIETKEGYLKESVAKEWYRLIGFLDYDEALKKFDDYLALPEGNKFAPDVKWFLNQKSKPKQNYFRANVEHKWKVIDYRLYDEEDREFDISDDHFGWYIDLSGNVGVYVEPEQKHGRIIYRFAGRRNGC